MASKHKPRLPLCLLGGAKQATDKFQLCEQALQQQNHVSAVEEAVRVLAALGVGSTCSRPDAAR